MSTAISRGTIPPIGLGVWKISKDVAGQMVYDAIVNGVRHFDCACDYGNEVEVGSGFRRALQEGICTREELWITSKLWNTYHAKEHVEIACRKSLSDLGIDYLDLYLVHFPICLKFVPFETRYPPEWIYDPTAPNPKIELQPVPLAETWGAMENLVSNGLTRHIGICNVMVFTLMDILSYARIPPAVLQVELHPYLTQATLLEYCKENNIQVTGYSPLGSGSYVELGGDAGCGIGPLKEQIVLDIARETGRTAAQVILKWGVQRGCSVIPKSSNLARIRENFDLSFTLSDAQMESISSLNRNQRFNNPGVYGKFMGATIPIFD